MRVPKARAVAVRLRWPPVTRIDAHNVGETDGHEAADATGQALGSFPGVDCFSASVEDGRIVLVPLRPRRGEAVRTKLAELGISEEDVKDAVVWHGGTTDGPRVRGAPAWRVAIGR